jgi:hypothetical protein
MPLMTRRLTADAALQSGRYLQSGLLLCLNQARPYVYTYLHALDRMQ